MHHKHLRKRALRAVSEHKHGQKSKKASKDVIDYVQGARTTGTSNRCLATAWEEVKVPRITSYSSRRFAINRMLDDAKG